MGRRENDKRNQITKATRLFTRLTKTLPGAVVQQIEKFAEEGGPSEGDFEAAHAVTDRLITAGTLLVLGCVNRGMAAELTADLAHAAAVLSFLPGGITVLRKKYVTTLDKADDGPRSKTGNDQV